MIPMGSAAADVVATAFAGQPDKRAVLERIARMDLAHAKSILVRIGRKYPAYASMVGEVITAAGLGSA